MTVIFFMESGLGWEVALENGPLRRALLVTDSLVPIPLVAGGSGTYLTGLETQLSIFRHQLRGRTMLRSRQWRESRGRSRDGEGRGGRQGPKTPQDPAAQPG